MKLIWMVVPALVAVAAAGCSDDKSDNKQSAASSSAEASSAATTAPETGGDDGVRIALGETKKVAIPADAVMDIRVPADWGQAANGLRCTASDSSGRNEDLRSSDVKKTESVNGKDWMTVWTFSAAPIGDVTVGCKDPESKIAPAHPDPYVRVVPRGVMPTP